jgi:hypothetical protein
MLRKRDFFASLKSKSEKKRHMPIDRSRTNGCSIWLNQPMNCVASRRGIRLVSKKLRSSCASKRRMGARSVILP